MNVYICSAARTAIGTYGGTLRDVHPSVLGIATANAAIERAGVDKEAIDEVIFGQVLQGGVGQNVARQVMVGAGLPLTTPAMTLNKVCASSMRAISLGSQIIRSGEDQMLLVGGCESMSGAPYITRNMRWGARMNDVKMVDMMVYDGVFDVFNQYHMGITAENVAEKYGITREMQDQIGYESQMKAAKAISTGRFKDEIVPIEVKKKKETIIFDTDEHCRPQHHPRGPGQAAPGVQEGRHGHRRQRIGHQRCGRCYDHRVGRLCPRTRPQASGQDPCVRLGRLRPLHHGHRPDRILAPGAQSAPA